MEIIIIIGMICFFGAFVQSLIGFGYAVFVTPLISLILGPKLAIVFSIITSTFTSYILFFHRGAYSELKNVRILALMAIIGTPVGIFLLFYFNENIIRFLISIAIFVSAGVTLRKKNNAKHNDRISLQIIFGLMSGVMRGTVSMGGPPVVIYQNWVGGTPDVIRNKMYAFFAWISPVGIIFLLPSGLIDFDLIKLIPTSIVFISLGIFVGVKNRAKISSRLFHYLSVSLLFLVSVIGITNTLLIWF